jgi:hypothetical protein
MGQLVWWCMCSKPRGLYLGYVRLVRLSQLGRSVSTFMFSNSDDVVMLMLWCRLYGAPYKGEYASSPKRLPDVLCNSGPFDNPDML